MSNEIIIYTEPENSSLSTHVNKPVISPVRAYLNTLSARSRNTEFQALKKFARIWADIVHDETGRIIDEDIDIFNVDWSVLDYGHMSLIRAKLDDLIANRELSPNYCNNILAGIKGVMTECMRLGLITREQLANVTDFKSFKVNHKRKGITLSIEDIRGLISVCDDGTNLGVRDAALIAMLVTTGMRRQELCNLRVEDVNVNTLRVQINAGKGNKNRVVFMSKEAAIRVHAWLKIRPNFENNPFLFLPIQRYGYVANRPLNTQTVQLVLKTRAAQAGLPEIHPHDLRKAFATLILNNGGDIANVSKLLGHSNVATTIAHYDLRGEDTLKSEASKLPKIEF